MNKAAQLEGTIHIPLAETQQETLRKRNDWGSAGKRMERSQLSLKGKKKTPTQGPKKDCTVTFTCSAHQLKDGGLKDLQAWKKVLDFPGSSW